MPHTGKEVKTMNWAQVNDYAIHADKTLTRFDLDLNDEEAYWYSPSLDLMIIDRPIYARNIKGWDLDTILQWLFINWRRLSQDELISIQSILNGKA